MANPGDLDAGDRVLIRAGYYLGKRGTVKAVSWRSLPSWVYVSVDGAGENRYRHSELTQLTKRKHRTK